MSASSLTPPKRVREPKVFPSYPMRRLLTTLITSPSLLAQILPTLVPVPPRWLRLFIYILLAVNISNFPGLWHITLFRPLLIRILRATSYPAALLGSPAASNETTDPKTGRQIRLEVLPLGKDIFENKLYRQHRAWPGDCDYLFHLSNSSYPKLLDYSRAALASSHFYRFISDGGRPLLGGCSFQFHREIPIMAKFEVQIRVASWDDKWGYLVGEFTSPTDPSTRAPSEPVPTSTPGTSSRTPRISLSRSASNLRGLLADISKPEHEAAAAAAAGGKRLKSHTIATAAGDETKESASPSYFPSGAQGEGSSTETIVYCTSVSRYCFKYGRKTIPPWFVIATSGFGTWASTRTNWDRAEEIRVRCAQEIVSRSSVRKGKRESAATVGKKHAWEGLLSAFDPRQEKDKATSRGHDARQNAASGSGWDRDDWSLSEWEPRRRQGLELVEKLGGLAPPV